MKSIPLVLVSLLCGGLAAGAQEPEPAQEPEQTQEPAPEGEPQPTEEPEAGILEPAPPPPRPLPQAEEEDPQPWLEDLFGAPHVPLRERPPSWLDGLSVGLSLDLFAEFTEARDSIDEFNRARVRHALLHVASPVPATGSVYASFDYADGGGGSDLVLREAAAVVDRMPGGWWLQGLRLRAGKYYADLGAWNTVLPYEFPAPSLDGTRRGILGGNVATTGVEAQYDHRLERGFLHGSLGLASDVERQDADAPGNGIEGDPGFDRFGRVGINNWAATGRVSYQRDLAPGMRARVGLSGFFAPEEITFTDLGGGTVERNDVRHWTAGADAGFLWAPEGSAWEHEVSLEVWVDESEYRSMGGAYLDEDARGEWAMYSVTFRERWTGGLLASRHDVLGLHPRDVDASYHSAFAGYRFAPGNRVHLFVTHTNPGPGEEKFFTVGGEWTFDLGGPRSAALPRWR